MPKKDGSPTAAEKRAAEAAEEQHPALEGAEGVEVAQRSQDEEKPSVEVHKKKFVVLARDYYDDEATHLANVEATRQAMIGQGLRPTADGGFVGAEKHPDGVSLVLTYEVPAKAAVVATEQHVAHAHVTLDDQHAAEGDTEA